MKLVVALVAILALLAGPVAASHLNPQPYGVRLPDQTKVCRQNLLNIVLQVQLYDTDPEDYNAPIFALYLYRGKVFLLYSGAEDMVYIDVDGDGVYDRKLPSDHPLSYSPCEVLKNIKNENIKKLNHDRGHRH